MGHFTTLLGDVGLVGGVEQVANEHGPAVQAVLGVQHDFEGVGWRVPQAQRSYTSLHREQVRLPDFTRRDVVRLDILPTVGNR